jgi:hypothetical protein
MAHPWVADRGDGLHIRTVAANILISRRGQPTRDGPPVWVLGKKLTTPHRKKKKNKLVRKQYTGPLAASCDHDNDTSGSIKDGEFLD